MEYSDEKICLQSVIVYDFLTSLYGDVTRINK